jgi:hypothetical protein
MKSVRDEINYYDEMVEMERKLRTSIWKSFEIFPEYFVDDSVSFSVNVTTISVEEPIKNWLYEIINEKNY